MTRLSPVLEAGPLLGVTSRRAIRRRLEVLGVQVVEFGPRQYVDLARLEAAVEEVTAGPARAASPALPAKMAVREGRAF